MIQLILYLKCIVRYTHSSMHLSFEYALLLNFAVIIIEVMIQSCNISRQNIRWRLI